MDLLNKITNNIQDLTPEEFALINNDPILLDAFVKSLLKLTGSLDDFFSKIPDELIIKIFFIEEVFRFITDYYKKEDEAGFLQMIFDDDEMMGFITPENEETAMRLIGEIREQYYPMVEDKLINDPDFSFYTNSPLLIDIIIDNKLYDKARFINLEDDKVSAKVEDFLIEVLQKTDVDLRTKTQKIVDYCMENHCLDRIIMTFRPFDQDDAKFIKEAFEEGAVTYEKLKNSSFSETIVDSPSLIIQKLADGYHLTPEQIEYTKGDESLIKEIVLLMSKCSGEANYAISNLAKHIPEIEIAIIKYDLAYKYNSESTLEQYLNHKRDDLLRLFKEKHDLVVDAVKFCVENNADRRINIADRLIVDDDLLDLRNVVFNVLPNTDYTTLFYRYVNSTSSFDIENYNNLLHYILVNNIIINLTDVKVLEKGVKIPFEIYVNLLKSITKDQLKDIDVSVIASTNFSNEDKQVFMNILIDKAIEFKSSFLNNYIYFLKQYAKSEDINRLLENSAGLSISASDILNLKDVDSLKGKSYEELVDVFKYMFSLEPKDIKNIASILDGNNIEFLKWLLYSPHTARGSLLFETVRDLGPLFSIRGLTSEYLKIVKDFYLDVGYVPASCTFFLGEEVIKKATLDCDDEYYEMLPEHFRIEKETYRNPFIICNDSNEETYYDLLYERIKERLKQGKKVHYELIAMCDYNLSINKRELEELLKSPDIIWVNDLKTISHVSKLVMEEKGTEFIRKVVIPNLDMESINNYNLFRELASYSPEFLERLKVFAERKCKFRSSVLDLLEHDIDGSYYNFLMMICDNDLIDCNSLELYSLVKEKPLPLCDKIVIEKIIPNQALLLKYVKTILKISTDYNCGYEDYVAKEIDKQDSLSSNFVFKGFDEYPLYHKAILKALSEGRINANYYNFTNEFMRIDILQALLEYNEISINEIIRYLVHQYSNPNKELYDFLIPYICRFKRFDENNYRYLYEIYGNTMIPLIENEEFRYLCNRDIESIKRIVDLIEPRTLDRTMIEGINNSIRQNIFTSKNPQVMTIYTTIVALMQNDAFEEVRDYYLNTLLPAVGDNLEKLIIKTGNQQLLDYYKTDKKVFLNYLFDCVKDNLNIYMELFNTITDNYIIQKRNEFASQDNIFVDTNIEYTFEKKSLYDALFKELVNNDKISLIKYLGLPAYFKYNDIDEEDLGDHLIDYYTYKFLSEKGFAERLDKEQLLQVKKNIGKLKARFYERVEENTIGNNQLPREFLYLLDDPNFTSGIRKNLIFPTRSRDLGKELDNLNTKAIMENIISDPEKYNTLLEVIKKYRLLDWANLFDPTIKQLSIAGEVENNYSFINAFSQIYDSEKKILMTHKYPILLKEAEKMRSKGIPEETIKKYIENEMKVQFNAFKILKYCSIYSAIPNCYKILLGVEDFDLVKNNPGENAAHGYSVEQRMTRAIDVHLKAIKQQEVSIPSFISDKHLNDGKTLRVIVGNRAHPRNMTHGERTGACMRAHGYADQNGEIDLFEFSASNFNGFHVTFVDPETDQYVSRVSGFRNGNTVFLNQLRVSVNKNYSNEDVIEAMRLVAQEIIDASKDSEYPIENVVVSPSYALLGAPTQHLSQDNIGQGVYTGYHDVTSNAVVLATTGENGIAVPLTLKSDRHPHYKCVRVYPEEILGPVKDADKIRMQRITAIRLVLENEDDPDYYEGLDIDVASLEEDLQYVIISQDWFVALDSQMEIKSDIIPLDERAQVEFDEAMRKVTEYKESILAKSGGLTNG